MQTKLQQLRYFAAVYEQGSFSAAAEHVNATQSGVWMQVRKIEKRHDLLLFNRSPSGLTPTEAGRAFYAEVVKVLAAVRHAEQRVKSLSKVVTGHVSVGMVPAFTRTLLTTVLLRFAKEYPEVRLSVSEAYSGPLADEVAEGRLDFAIVPPALKLRETLVATPMGADRECFVWASDQQVSADGGRVVLQDLPPLRLVLPGVTNARRHSIEDYLAVNNIKVEKVIELDTMLGTLDLVSRSNWVAVLPRLAFLPDDDTAHREQSRHMILPLESPPLNLEFMRIAARSRPLSPECQALANVVQDELTLALQHSFGGSEQSLIRA